MDSFTRSLLMLFVLLNPFIMSVYLLDLMRVLHFRPFAVQLARAGVISFLVFALFAWAGAAIFDVMQVRFFAFLIFGGITFLIIGIRLIGQSHSPREIAPQDEEVAASIAMPYIIGPGTISASVVTGARLDNLQATTAIAMALAMSIAGILLFKWAHDFVRARNERLIRRYVEIAGRATGLFAGSFAIDMILRGLEGWMEVVTLP